MSDTVEQKKTTVSITVDGRPIEAQPGEWVIAAAERAGVYIPRFCYHPRMQPVGMCRMCLVEVDGPRGPALQVSCMINVSEGMVVHTDSPTVKKAQDGVLEFLLVNHPLDCPVCDKGGECPLQDQTVAYGPGESRFVEEKRHFEKPIPISDLVFLDRERCILCDRCTRFAKDVAGDPLIHFTERGNQTQVLTFPDHPFASYFSGNTVQICPVGALTAKPYRFKARPWDLERQESTCTTCAVGCRIAVESSRNQVLRYQGVDIDPVNWGWLCDKGRFGFEAVNSQERLAAPVVRDAPVGSGVLAATTESGLVEATWATAVDRAAQALRRALDDGGAASVAVLGGARLTNEDAYAWAKLAKGVIGTDNVDAQLADGLPASFVLGVPQATIDDACAATTVVLLAPDLKEELPVLYLRLRDAAHNRRLRILELSAIDSSLTPYAGASLRCRPGEQAAVVRALLGTASASAVGIEADDLARASAYLRPADGERIVIVAGRPSVAESAAAVVEATATLLAALPDAKVLPLVRRGNTRGAMEMGLTPGLLPGGVDLDDGHGPFGEAWTIVPRHTGLDATEILTAAAEGKIGCLVLLGADPVSDFPDRDLARRALAGAASVIAVDTFLTDSNRGADVILAATGPAEKSGTTTNIEGRISPLAQKVTPPGTARADWMIAADLAAALGADLGLESLEQIRAEIEQLVPAQAGLGEAFRQRGAGHDGIVPRSAGGFDPRSVTASELVPLDSYSKRLVAVRRLYDGGVTVRQSSSLAGLPAPAALRMNPTDHERLGLVSESRVKVSSSRGAVVVHAVADAGVPRGTVALGFNQANVAAADLIDATAAVTDVRVETIQ